jgi:hypothetical protein
MFAETMAAFANQPDDISLEFIFTDFFGENSGVGVNIPGQGYTIY